MVDDMDLYNDKGSGLPNKIGDKTELIVPSPPDDVVVLDLDKELTLGDVVKVVRIFAHETPDDFVLTLLFVNGIRGIMFPWKLVASYLESTERTYNVVFRGIFPDRTDGNDKIDPTNNVYVMFMPENINVFLTSDILINNPDNLKTKKYEII